MEPSAAPQGLLLADPRQIGGPAGTSALRQTPDWCAAQRLGGCRPRAACWDVHSSELLGDILVTAVRKGLE